MSDSAKVQAVREFIDKVDKGDTDGLKKYLTDDHKTKYHNKHGRQIGDVHDKHKTLEHHTTAQKTYGNVKTVIDKIEEKGGKVHVYAKTRYEHDKEVKEAPYRAEYEFDGNKISALHVHTEHE